MSHCLGVDFGTSNSAAGLVRPDGSPWLIAIEPGAQTLPTAVFFDFEEQEMLIGHAAQRALQDGTEGRYMRALKSLLGTALMRERRLLLGERLDFVQIIGRYLAVLKARAEAETGLTFDRALSGRPVNFHTADPARNAQAELDLRDAYMAAGFSDVAFMAEPEAAARANYAKLDQGDLGLIVDIGGGTSDFTLFRKDGDAEIAILASHGVRIGGTDFDRALSIAHVMPFLGMGTEIRHAFGAKTHRAPNAMFNDLATWAKIPFLYTAETRRAAQDLARHAVEPARLKRLVSVLEDELGHDLAFAVEAGKIAANSGSAAGIALDVLRRGASQPLTPEAMSATLAALAQDIGNAAQEPLTVAGVGPDAVDHLIFVGGSSLMGVVEAALCAQFPKAKLQRGSALTAIVDGLALCAGDPAFA